MHTRVQIASVAVAMVILVGVFELVRRRKLGERYALLWLGAGFVLLVLAVWQHLLYEIAHAVGIYYPPNAFFVIAFGFALLLLLHFSTATSRLATETRTLAQQVALLEARLEAYERAEQVGEPGGGSSSAEDEVGRGRELARQAPTGGRGAGTPAS